MQNLGIALLMVGSAVCRSVPASNTRRSPAAIGGANSSTDRDHFFVASGGDTLRGPGEREINRLCSELDRSDLFTCSFVWGSGAEGIVSRNGSVSDVRDALADLSDDVQYFVGDNDRMINPEYHHTANPVPKVFEGWFTYEQSVALFQRKSRRIVDERERVAPSLTSPQRPLTIAKLLEASRRNNVGGGRLNVSESVLPTLQDDTVTTSVVRAQKTADLSDQARDLNERTLVVQHLAPEHLGTLSTYSKCLRKCRESTNFYFSASGRNVTIYVIDSPVVDHVQFKNMRTGLSRLSSDRFLSPAARRSRSTCAGDHGTHVAGLAAGVEFGTAKNAVVVSVGAQPGCGGAARVTDILAGLQWTLDHHIRTRKSEMHTAVATMSLMLKSTTQSSAMITKYVKKLSDNGITVVAAAGNFHDNACNYVPPNMADVITVGAAHVSNGSIRAAPWFWSNWGPCVDVFAPGYRVESASPNCFECVAEYSGTSIATPLVAGIAAQYLQKFRNTTAESLKRELVGESTTQLLDVSRYPYQTTPSRFAQSFLGLEVLKVTPVVTRLNLTRT